MSLKQGMSGSVYILENREAGRVKIGMTSGLVNDRAEAVNKLWKKVNVTCQVCDRHWHIPNDGRLPIHPKYGRHKCPGSEQLPLEYDDSVAKTALAKLDNSISSLSGVKRAAATKRSKSLRRRIEQKRHQKVPIGHWHARYRFAADEPEVIEKAAHAILEDWLDSEAPLGEIFICTMQQAIAAVEDAFRKKGLGVKRHVIKERRSEFAGKPCLLCGEATDAQGKCGPCAREFARRRTEDRQ